MSGKTVDRATQEIRNSLQAAMSVQNADFTTSSGGYGIDLLGAAALLRLNTPYTDRLPRLKSDTGLSAQWWEFQMANGRWGSTTNPTGTAAQGYRGGSIGWSGTLRTAAYKSLSLDAAVTDEARYSTGGIIDPLSLNMAATLLEVKRSHHMQNLFGRSGFAITTGAGAAPTVTAATSGGALADATYYTFIVPINGAAWQRTKGYAINSTSWSGAASPATGSELLDFSRTNGDGTSTTVKGGTGQISSVGSGTISGGSGAGKLTISWTPIKGAIAYAVFIGTTSGAANAVFQGVTNAAKYVQTVALKTAGQAAGTNFDADNSVDTLEYDGLLTLLCEANSPAQYLQIANGTSLSSGANMQLDQLDPVLAYFYRQYDGYSPDRAYMSGATKVAVENAIMSNATASRGVMMISTAPGSDVTPTGNVTRLRNPYTSSYIEITEDPYIPDGKIILAPDTIPSKVSATVTQPVFFRAQEEFKGEAWPRTARKWANAVHLIGALCTPWRAGHAVIDNVQ